MTVKVSELNLGDIVRLSDSPYSTATVKNVTDTEVTFFRPYVHTADFSCTAGVICYIGLEEFSVYKSNSTTVELLKKGEPLK